jgi:hypothetical protein
MPHLRKILKKPKGTNFFLVDANFLANRFIPERYAPNVKEHNKIRRCSDWWKEIDSQVKDGAAKIYVPDVCIAEAFKVLAKKYYKEKWFTTSLQYKSARDRLHKFIKISSRELKAATRKVQVHDISTSRDIIISIDRFFETFFKHNLKVSVPDLIILSTAKYLIDFFGIPSKSLFIITLDRPLWKGSKKIYDVPNAFDPTADSEIASKIFSCED